MDAQGGNVVRLTDDRFQNEDPCWSPDGKQIAFHSDRAGGMNLFIINTDGSGLRQLTDSRGKNGIADWSPDGLSIAYSANRFFGWNVHVVGVDGKNDRRLSDGHGACRPDWSPDGQTIAFVSQKNDGKGDIWTMDIHGQNACLITHDAHHYDYDPAWSPDGKYLVFAKTDDKKRGNWELHVISADGAETLQITHHEARDVFPDWAKTPENR